MSYLAKERVILELKSVNQDSTYLLTIPQLATRIKHGYSNYYWIDAGIPTWCRNDHLIIAERYIFHQRGQHLGESIAEYVAELRRLARLQFW